MRRLLIPQWIKDVIFLRDASMRKEEAYKTIKIAGMVSYLPFIMAACPVAGYFAGDYLQKKFSLPGYTVIILTGLSFIAGALEAVKVIRKVNKIILK